ncbi:MAG: hypothetical protein M5R36_28835 [Deltaproteobacteria bacterium]|nr:hypothetical protein [Deltaproteobacteria bacterium]
MKEKFIVPKTQLLQIRRWKRERRAEMIREAEARKRKKLPPLARMAEDEARRKP